MCISRFHPSSSFACPPFRNQYFLGSAFAWDEDQGVIADNLIPVEIAEKICQKIREGQPFAAYIITPMFPEGDPVRALVSHGRKSRRVRGCCAHVWRSACCSVVPDGGGGEGALDLGQVGVARVPIAVRSGHPKEDKLNRRKTYGVICATVDCSVWQNSFHCSFSRLNSTAGYIDQARSQKTCVTFATNYVNCHKWSTQLP